ncbi:MAG: hypothetical protein V5A44_00080 [Haloarculaceae archaeon]
MLYRPSALPPDRRERFERHAEGLRKRLLDHVETLLTELDSEAAGRLVYELAFKPGEALPKRSERPKLDSALLAEQVYLQHDPDGELLDPVLEYTVATQEYFDMLDDLVDGDAREDRRAEVVLATQLLLPLVVRRLDRLDATAYWCGETTRLLEAPLEEVRTEPSAAAYRDGLEVQATLYGATAGIAALAGGADEAAAERAKAVGKAIYQHKQVVLDYEQFLAGHAERWNAGALFDDEAAVLTYLRDRRATVSRRVEPYDDTRASLLEGLVALDTDAWLAGFDG